MKGGAWVCTSSMLLSLLLSSQVLDIGIYSGECRQQEVDLGVKGVKVGGCMSSLSSPVRCGVLGYALGIVIEKPTVRCDTHNCKERSMG